MKPMEVLGAAPTVSGDAELDSQESGKRLLGDAAPPSPQTDQKRFYIRTLLVNLLLRNHPRSYAPTAKR